MATNATQLTDGNIAAATPKTPRVKSVLEDLSPKSPYYFDSAEDAANFLTKCQADIPDFESYPFIANGIDDEGDFNPDVYTDATRVMVHVLTNRGTTTKDAQGTEIKTPATIRAIVVTPVPRISAIEADELGRKWLDKIINTQIAHVAVAVLRKSEDLNLARRDMPGVITETVPGNEGEEPLEIERFNLASFFSGRESGGVMETYDKLFRGIIDGFSIKSKAWKRSRLNKAELKKALESKAYALAVYSPLEDRGDKPSMFVMAAQVGIREAKEAGLDPTVFEQWLDSRDDKAASTGADEEDDDFDLDDIVLAQDEQDAKDAETATTEVEAPEQPVEGESTDEPDATAATE